MSKEWYFAKDDEKHGPFSLEEMTEYLKSGKVRGKTLVWSEGMEDWTSANDVEDFKPFSSKISGPPPIKSNKTINTDSVPSRSTSIGNIIVGSLMVILASITIIIDAENMLVLDFFLFIFVFSPGIYFSIKGIRSLRSNRSTDHTGIVTTEKSKKKGSEIHNMILGFGLLILVLVLSTIGYNIWNNYSKPTVVATFRKSALEEGWVLRITNTGSKTLFTVTVEKVGSGKELFAAEKLEPEETIEIGWIEYGRNFFPGEEIKIGAHGYLRYYSCYVPQ